jgi:hypothetical protein
MQKNFTALSGEALKKPLLEISDKQGLLDGQAFEISPNTPIPFNPLFFKNTGDKRTEPLSIQLFSSADLFQQYGGGDWVPTSTVNKDYPFCYYSSTIIESRTAGVGIAPQETYPLQGQGYQQLVESFTNVVACKLVVFYGADKPAEAKFVIKFK